MIQFFRNLRFEITSFWAGFIAATLVWWIFKVANPAIKKGWENIKKVVQTSRKGMRTSAEQRFLTDSLKYVQNLHLAAGMFSLDEILIHPALMAPPVLTDPDTAPPYEDVVSAIIPFTPDWPEMAAAYQATTLDIFDVLELNNRICLTGSPGTGKTTTLAFITTKLSRREVGIGELQHTIPFFVHINDLDLDSADGIDPLDILLAGVSTQVSKATMRRLPEMMRSSFDNNTALLLLDGLDELSYEKIRNSITFLGNLLKKYKEIKVVVATDVDHLGNLPQLGFSPIPMAIWDKNKQAQFIHKWGFLWEKFIQPGNSPIIQGFIDPLILTGWLSNLYPSVTPFDFTLTVWGAYSGDARGLNRNELIESFFRRMMVETPDSRTTLETLASAMIHSQQLHLTESEFKAWLSQEAPEFQKIDSGVIGDKPTQTDSSKVPASLKSLTDLVQTRLIVIRPNQKIGFVHPIIAGYLAGITFTQRFNFNIFSQPSWPMKNIAITSMKSPPGIGPQIDNMLRGTEDPLLKERLVLGRWLPNYSKNVMERNAILTRLNNDLKNEMLPLTLRFKVLTALANVDDPGISTLFRNLLNSPHENVQHLAVIGCGYLRDEQSVPNLVKKLGDVTKVGQAACLALVNIGTKAALEGVASVLLRGHEQLRRAAAEAFSTHPIEGYPILRDGSSIDDLMTRRAVIYGLRKIDEPWAIDILEKLQVEDAQWLIKDSASQALEDIRNPDPAIPIPLPQLEDLPWLIAFAGDRGVGISKGKSAKDMLLRVVEEGSEELVIAALGQIQRRGILPGFPILYTLYFGDNINIREEAFQTLQLISSMGIDVPILSQEGM